MTRRALGIAVVALAVLAALLVPSLDGRRIVGSAQPQPIPPAPAVGSCVLGPLGAEPSALTFTGARVDNARLGTCGGENYGEVVAVVGSYQDFPMSRSGGSSGPDPQACALPARRYLDRSSESALSDDDATRPWRPVATRRVSLIGPDIWQYLGGQRWLACVIHPRQSPYPGSVRATGAPTGTAAAAVFSSCMAMTDTPEPEDVPCGSPHTIEVFAVTRRGGDDAAAITGACHSLVAGLTGMTDLTAGGRLVVAAVRSPEVTAPPGSSFQQSPRWTCQARTTGSVELRAGLLGWGDRPLPLG